jgi:tetratricopeptide (TPR) repeat protein
VQALFAGDFAKAESAARQQLAADSRSVDALVLLARAQMVQGRYPLAFSSLRKALTYSPNHIEALYFMGKLASALSQNEYQRLAQSAPDSARVHQLMGDGYQAAGDLDKAQEEYRTALARQPELTDVALELAEILRTQGRFEEALKFYLQILEHKPRHFQSLYGAGLCYQVLQDDDRCLEYFKRAADADPRDAASRFALGATFMRMQQPVKAIEALKAAVRLDPSLQGAYSLLGRALTMTGQPELAAQAFEKAKQLMSQELQSRQEKAKKVIDAPVKD